MQKIACTLLALVLMLIPMLDASAQPGPPTSAPRPGREVPVTQFDAIGDGRTLNTKFIQAAIDDTAANGGGTAVVPSGVFLSGAIFLKPGVNLRLERGAVLKGSTDINDYPKMLTRIEGHFEPWRAALVNADRVDHLRITGEGMLDGSGQPFWELFWKRIKEDPKTTNLSVERPRLCFIQNSKDVTISGIHFKDSGFWNLHIYRCSEVTVEDSRFEVPRDVKAPSTDGTDIDSCQNVTIRRCVYCVDDDAVCIKGSKGPFALDDKDSPPVEHIRVIDCTFETGHGAVTLGSEATVIRDVIVEGCKVTGAIPLVRLKLRPDTPQLYEDIHYRNITLAGSGAIFQVQPWKQYFNLQGQPPPKSIVRNVTLSNIKGSFGSLGTISGNPETEISGISVENVDVTLKKADLKLGTVKDLMFNKVIVNGEAYVPPTVR